MDTVSRETICAKSYKEKIRTRKGDKVIVKGERQSLDQSNTDTRLADNVTERNLILEGLQIKEEAQSVGTKINTGPTEVISEECDTGNRKKKRKRIPRAEIEAEVRCEMDARNFAEGNPTTMKPKFKDQVQKTSSNIMDKESTENPAGKMKKKRKGKKANLVGDVQNELDARSTDNLDEENLTIKIPKVGLTRMNTGSAEDRADVNVIIEHPKTLNEAQSMGQDTMDTWQLAENIVQGNVAGKRRKKRNKNKAKVNDEDHREMNTRSTENLIEENAALNELGIKDAAQGVTQTQTNTGSTDNVAERNVSIENLKVQDETQSMDQAKLISPSKDLAEGNVTVKNKKKLKKTKKANVKGEFSSRMDAELSKNLAEVDAKIRIPETRDEVPSMGPKEMEAGSTENLMKAVWTFDNPNIKHEGENMDKVLKQGVHVQDNVTIESPKVQDGIQSIDQAKRIMPTEDFSEGNVTVKSKKKRKKTKKANVKDEFSSRMDVELSKTLAEVDAKTSNPETRDEGPSMGPKVMDAGSTKNLMKGVRTFDNPKIKHEGESMDKVLKQRVRVQDNVTIENPKVQDGIQSVDQAKRIMPTEDFSEGNVTVKSKKKQKKTKKANVRDEFSSRMDVELSKNLAEVDANIRIPETRDEVPSMGLKVIDAGSTENLRKGNLTFEHSKITDEGQSMDSGPAKDFTKAGKRKNKRRSTRKRKIVSEHPSEGRGGIMLNGSSQVSKIILDEGIDHREGRSATSTCNACSMKDTEDLCLRMAPFASVRRKLLVLDINGLLADVVYPAPKHDRGEDIRFYGRAVFTRPFCGDFLKFCFQNFNVGIWSSRSKKIIDKVVSYLLGDQKDKLLFCWDMAHSTPTGFKTLENCHKPLVCKELRKIWEKDDPSWPWEKGDYNESNTLLLDDSPYKALLNPLHTAIFPHPFQYSDKNDNSLGPGGDLRVYLEGLLASENVQKYVEQHPFGQSPISEEDISWEFYDRVLKQISKDKTSLVETQIDHQEPPS